MKKKVVITWKTIQSLTMKLMKSLKNSYKNKEHFNKTGKLSSSPELWILFQLSVLLYKFNKIKISYLCRRFML